MLRKWYFLLILLLVTSLDCDANPQLTPLDSSLLKPIQDTKLHQSVNIFKEASQKSNQDYLQWGQGSFWPLMDKTSSRMIEQKKIYSLTPEIRRRYNLDEKYCFEKENKKKHSECTRMDAFYIPELDIIFIDETIPENEFAFLLFHELVHVYQNDYRLPLDLALLKNMSQTPENAVQEEDILDMLNFHYEAQAHWYKVTLESNKDWFEYAKNSNFLEGAGKIGFGMVVHLLSFGQAVTLDRVNEVNGLIPEISCARLKEGLFSFKGKSAFKIPELIVADYRTNLNLGSNYDFSTHRHYAERLEETQFGQLNFLASRDNQSRKTQEVFKVLTDVYYDLLVNASEDDLKKCTPLLNKVQNSNLSPMLMWRNLKQSDFDGCPIYQGVQDETLRRQAIDTYRTFTGQTPFNLNEEVSSEPGGSGTVPGGSGTVPGGSGTVPGGSGTVPGLIFFPQIEIKP